MGQFCSHIQQIFRNIGSWDSGDFSIFLPKTKGPRHTKTNIHVLYIYTSFQVNVEEESKVNGLELGITFLVLFKKHFSEFKWRKNSTGSTFWIDNLVGSTTLREGVDSGLQVDEIMSQWQDDLTHFSILRAKYLLYQ